MQREPWTLQSRGGGRQGAGWEVVRGVFGAGHLVDLHVTGGEDAAPACPRDPALQPLIVHLSGYTDHLALEEDTTLK